MPKKPTRYQVETYLFRKLGKLIEKANKRFPIKKISLSCSLHIKKRHRKKPEKSVGRLNPSKAAEEVIQLVQRKKP